MSDVFISYSRKDIVSARLLNKDLEEREQRLSPGQGLERPAAGLGAT